MSDITASLVRNLRLETSAGMMDCKRALQESGGDVTEAKAWLRKKGLAGAQAKASRATDQGLVAIAVKQKKAAVVLELNAETDFVARNPSFQDFLRKAALRALEVQAKDVETLLATSFTAGGDAGAGAGAERGLKRGLKKVSSRRCKVLSGRSAKTCASNDAPT